MSEAVLLQQIEDRLADLVIEADRLADEPAAAAMAWKPLFDKLRTQAKATLAKARAPVKIGVVGEFSAGKTLLLGGLIGYADALPVKEIATTGNVTALRFTSVDGIATTEVGPYRIDFLDHAGFVECLRYMLKEAARRAKSSDISEDLRERLGAIKADDDQAPSKVDDWGRAAWGRTGNPALRYSIRELVRFVRAYMRCGAGLCESGEPIVVDARTAVRGLELEPVQDNIQTATFADIPTPTHTLSSRPETLSAEQLRAAFPLIRLVTIDVKLSRGVWDFAGLGQSGSCSWIFPAWERIRPGFAISICA